MEETIIFDNQGAHVRLFWDDMYKVDWHSHENLRLVYNARGKILLHIEEDILFLEKNQVAVVNAHQMHYRSFCTPEQVCSKCLILEFDMEYYTMLFPELYQKKFLIKSGNSENDEKYVSILQNMFSHILKVALEQEEGYYLKVSCMSEYILIILSEFFTAEEIIPNISKSLSENPIQQVLDYLEKHYAENWSLELLGSLVGLHPTYLSRQFSKIVGVKISQYINSLRVKKSVRDLLYYKIPIVEIAEKHGFSNVNAYYKAFKEIFGDTPRVYKKRIMKNKSDFLGSEIPIPIQNSTCYDYMQEVFQESNLISEAAFHCGQEGVRIKTLHESLCIFQRCADTFDNDWKRKLVSIQSKMRFQYMYCYDLLADSMCGCIEAPDGELRFSFSRIDSMIHFLRENDIIPILGIENVHEKIVKRNGEQYKDYKKDWLLLMQNMTKHFIDEFGVAYVYKWEFNIFTDPFDSTQWHGTFEEFIEFFCDTAEAIRSVDECLRVGGSNFYCDCMSTDMIKNFFQGISARNIRLDFLTVSLCGRHCEKVCSQYDTIVKCYKFINCKSLIKDLRRLAAEFSMGDIKIIITRFPSSENSCRLKDNSCREGVTFVKRILEFIGGEKSMLCAEVVANKQLDHSYNLFTDIYSFIPAENGIRSVLQNVCYFFGRLGEEALIQGDDYIVSRKSDFNLSILYYNYQERERNMPNEVYALDICDIKRRRKFIIHGMQGRNKIKIMRINRYSGTLYDAWQKIGIPSSISFEELNYLYAKSIPDLSVEEIDFGETHEMILEAEPFEIVLAEIIRN